MIFNNNEIDLIEYCIKHQSIDFNEKENVDMTSILYKLRQQREAITNTYGGTK
tara:strand:+ start:188 stop:346 length:159 start_codon:yes stop_codon:yes gene_type:complete